MGKTQERNIALAKSATKGVWPKTKKDKEISKGQQMITIDQLLESVDLDFEPRWIAKDNSGLICVYTEKPERGVCSWYDGGNYIRIGYLKLAEFENKDWQKCIYEVPQKTTGKIEKITGVLSTMNGKRKIVFPSDVSQEDIISKLHEVIDAVNELKGEIQ